MARGVDTIDFEKLIEQSIVFDNVLDTYKINEIISKDDKEDVYVVLKDIGYRLEDYPYTLKVVDDASYIMLSKSDRIFKCAVARDSSSLISKSWNYIIDENMKSVSDRNRFDYYITGCNSFFDLHYNCYEVRGSVSICTNISLNQTQSCIFHKLFLMSTY